MTGITGESSSPRTSHPILRSSSLKKLLFSRTAVIFLMPAAFSQSLS
jgi:hypothetical protein